MCVCSRATRPGTSRSAANGSNAVASAAFQPSCVKSFGIQVAAAFSGGDDGALKGRRYTLLEPGRRGVQPRRDDGGPERVGLHGTWNQKDRGVQPRRDDGRAESAALHSAGSGAPHGCPSPRVFSTHLSTSATLHACATQPRGTYGASASKISLIDPTHPSLRCASKPSSSRRAPSRSDG